MWNLLMSWINEVMTASITPRERQVLQQISYGLTTKEIASKLYVSDHTIISHRKHLLEKLEAPNVAGLMRRAFETGILRISCEASY